MQSGYIASFFSDCNARWQQAVRHMWGSLGTSRPNIGPVRKLTKIFKIPDMLRTDFLAGNLGFQRAVRSTTAWHGSRCDKGLSTSPQKIHLRNVKGLVLDLMKTLRSDRVPQWTSPAASSFLRNGFETITDPRRLQAMTMTYRHLHPRHPARLGADPPLPGTRPFLLTIRILPRTRTWSSILANPQHLM